TYVSTKSPANRQTNLHVVTGKPVGSGGLEGRDRATGFGVVATIKSWVKLNNIDLKGKTYIVQGFGNVGYWASHFMQKEGAKLIAVQDASGSIINSKGIDPDLLNEHCRQNKGAVAGFSQAGILNNADFFATECDIIIPAALGNQITVENAPSIKAQLIAEGANGPTTVEAEEILLEKGIKIIPDILCNSGGVIGSYYEWLQNKRSENWKIEDVLIMIEDKISAAFNKVLQSSEQFKTDWRISAYIVALQRIELTYIERGVFP
ncbi:MAG: glutamate dehydrogenase, partial [Flavobacteriales bacterium]|nr:glutamate dehydrogenase [Flavobacteriales bacterium]